MKFKSQVLTQASGSIGGITYSHNRGGMYQRARAIPTNPNTPAQQLVRGGLAAAVAYWANSMTDAERLVWSTYAGNTPTTDALGDPLILTGQQAFLRWAVTQPQVGGPLAAGGPTIFDRGQPVSYLQGDLGGVQNVLGVASNALSNGVQFAAATDAIANVLFQIGRPVGPGVNFYKGPFCFVSSTSVASGQTGVSLTATAEDAFPFADLIVGQRRPVRLVARFDDGRVSAAYSAILPVIVDTI